MHLKPINPTFLLQLRHRFGTSGDGDLLELRREIPVEDDGEAESTVESEKTTGELPSAGFKILD